MLDSIQLGCAVFEVNPINESQYLSARRALRALAREGSVVDMGRGWVGGAPDGL